MELLQNILLISSCFMLIALAIRTGTNLKLVGMPALFAMILFFMIWVIGDLIEINSSDFYGMLWGRNIAQIGVFFMPLSTLYFSICYTSNKKLLKFAYIISVIQVISVFLIFTDQFHHIMRENVTVEMYSVFGRAISVKSTKIGSLLVGFNFCIPLISVANLMNFMRKISAKLRRPLSLIIISMLATFVLAVIQSSFLLNIGINIPIPVLNLPCMVLLSYAVLKGGFVGIEPTVLNQIFEVIDQGIIVIDETGQIIEYNKRASELIDNRESSDSLKIGSPILKFITNENDPRNQLFSIDALPNELKNEQKNLFISLERHRLKTERKKLVGHVIVLTDITSLKIRAEIDYLTGSYNREGIQNAFIDLKKQIKNTSQMSAMIIDLDNFKNINDTYGHFGGDMILRNFVGIVRAMLTEKYFLGRLGGDEFVIVLNAKIETATAIAEELRKSVSKQTVFYMHHEMRYTVSVGIAACTGEACALSDLLNRADIALYKAKNQGKNTINT